MQSTPQPATQPIDFNGILTLEHLIDKVADRVIARLQTDQRSGQMRYREELIHLLRAWEEMNDLPRSIPTKREREG